MKLVQGQGKSASSAEEDKEEEDVLLYRLEVLLQAADVSMDMVLAEAKRFILHRMSRMRREAFDRANATEDTVAPTRLTSSKAAVTEAVAGDVVVAPEKVASLRFSTSEKH